MPCRSTHRSADAVIVSTADRPRVPRSGWLCGCAVGVCPSPYDPAEKSTEAIVEERNVVYWQKRVRQAKRRQGRFLTIIRSTCMVVWDRKGKRKLSTELLGTLERWSGRTSIAERQQFQRVSAVVAHEVPDSAAFCTSKTPLRPA